MSRNYRLFLSPHPDDLVFSAYSALTQRQGDEALCITYFNISGFCRYGKLPVPLVTLWRTMEEVTTMRLCHAKVRFLFQRDQTTNSTTRTGSVLPCPIPKEIPKKIYCPLGIGGNPNHLIVRLMGIRYWKIWNRQPELIFYEDLPYAARISTDDPYSAKQCLSQISRSIREFKVQHLSLSEHVLAKKLWIAKMYASQTNYRPLIAGYARRIGQECNLQFAEKIYVAIAD